MLYLSQLLLHPRSPQVRGDLADCRALHSRVLHAFPDREDITAAREHFGLLYRVERFRGGARVLVQSHEQPDWSRLPAGYLRAPAGGPKRVDELYTRIVQRQTLLFRLRANPTKRVSKYTSDLRSPESVGKRVELRSEAAQVAWLARKGEAAGFALLHVEVAREHTLGSVPSTLHAARDDRAPVMDVRTSGTAAKVVRYLPHRPHQRKKDIDLAFGSVVFEGRLIVTDAERFRQALAVGIGSGKAFGFGLLSVAPSTPASV